MKVKVDTSMGGNIGETIKLQNIGPVDLNMTGWKIQDFTNKGARPNKSLDLNGSNFNHVRRILDIDLTGSQVRLNNDGDNVKIIDNMGNVHDVFSYDKYQVVKDNGSMRPSEMLGFFINNSQLSLSGLRVRSIYSLLS